MVTTIEWQGLTMLAILITFGLVSLAYAIGVGFKLPKLKAWADNEVYQAFGSLLLAVLVVAIIAGADSLLTAMANPAPLNCPLIAGNSIFSVVRCYMAALITNFLTTLGGLVGALIALGLLQSSTFIAMPYQVGAQVSWGAGLAPITGLLSFAISGAALAVLIMVMQYVVIGLIQNNVMILFPIGIFLRAFPFSRPAGAALIAVSLALYIIYPSLWLFDAYIYTGTPRLAYTSQTITALLANYCANWYLPVCIAVPFALVVDIANGLTGPLIEQVTYPLIYNLFIYAIMLPIFNLIITLIIMGDLADFFGGEIDVSGLMKVI